MKKLVLILSIVIAGVISVNAQQAANANSLPKTTPVMKVDQQSSAAKPAESCHAGANGKACCQKDGGSCQGHGGEGKVSVQSGKTKTK